MQSCSAIALSFFCYKVFWYHKERQKSSSCSQGVTQSFQHIILRIRLENSVRCLSGTISLLYWVLFIRDRLYWSTGWSILFRLDVRHVPATKAWSVSTLDITNRKYLLWQSRCEAWLSYSTVIRSAKFDSTKLKGKEVEHAMWMLNGCSWVFSAGVWSP